MNDVIAALKRAGGKELQTQQVSLYPQTDESGKVTGYVAQNTVSAKASIAGAGALVDAAVGCGGEHGRRPDAHAVGSGRALPERAEEGGRGRAGEGARARRGRRLRRRAGAAVVEQGATDQPVYAPPPPRPRRPPTPVEPGTQDVTADVTVSFTIR